VGHAPSLASDPGVSRWSPVGDHGDVNDPTQVRRPRHLMDPDNLVRPVNDHALTRVQRWVLSVLAVTTILHLSVGLVIGSFFLDDNEMVSRYGVCVIGGLFGVVAAAVGRLIHQKSVASWWLAVGFLPGAVGIVLQLTQS
jgi:hypothetical protein